MLATLRTEHHARTGVEFMIGAFGQDAPITEVSLLPIFLDSTVDNLTQHVSDPSAVDVVPHGYSQDYPEPSLYKTLLHRGGERSTSHMHTVVSQLGKHDWIFG